VRRRKPNLTIIGDGLAKGLGVKLHQDVHYNVRCTTKPGAKLHGMSEDVKDLIKNASGRDVIVLAVGEHQNVYNMRQYKRTVEEAIEISERREITLLLTTLNYCNNKSDVNRKLYEMNYYLYNLTRMCTHSHILETNGRNGMALHQNILYCLSTNCYKMRNIIQVQIDDGVTSVNNSRPNEPLLSQEPRDFRHQNVDGTFLDSDQGPHRRPGCSKDRGYLL
jgi:hypothetical protein